MFHLTDCQSFVKHFVVHVLKVFSHVLYRFSEPVTGCGGSFACPYLNIYISTCKKPAFHSSVVQFLQHNTHLGISLCKSLYTGLVTTLYQDSPLLVHCVKKVIRNELFSGSTTYRVNFSDFFCTELTKFKNIVCKDCKSNVPKWQTTEYR